MVRSAALASPLDDLLFDLINKVTGSVATPKFRSLGSTRTAFFTNDILMGIITLACTLLAL